MTPARPSKLRFLQSTDSRGNYYVSDAGLPTDTTQTIDDTDGETVVWGPLKLSKGQSFSRTIRAAIAGPVAASGTWPVSFVVSGHATRNRSRSE